jgi:hypothetical protein
LDLGLEPALGWFKPWPYMPDTYLDKRVYPRIVTSFEPDHCPEQIRTTEAFTLMLRLVQFSLNYLADRSKTESFNRYFQPSHRRTVFNVFRNYYTMANPPPPDDPSSPVFANVDIVYGKQPFSDPNDCLEGDKSEWYAHFYNSIPGNPNTDPSALILCPAVFAAFPIEIPEPGDTSRCSILAPFATYDMDSLGATLLHEFLHMNVLVNHATSAGILDWNAVKSPVLPRSGYGPYNSFYLNQKSTMITTPQRDPRLNADNYVYFALEVYVSTSFSYGQTVDLTSDFSDRVARGTC